jgi:hypothetical protein
VRTLNLISAAVAAALAVGSAPAAAAPVLATTNADGKALILVPLTLTKIQDLDFGSLVSSPSAGTVTINASTGARTVAGGVTEVLSDAGFRAYFAGAGSPNQQVIVAISPPLALDDGVGNTIPVLGLTLDGSPFRTIDPVARTFFVGVGGTLQIAANQPEGVYDADFWVTAIYQ